MSYFINRDDIISVLEDRLNSKIKESAGMKFPEYTPGLSGSIDELKSIIDIIKNQQDVQMPRIAMSLTLWLCYCNVLKGFLTIC